MLGEAILYAAGMGLALLVLISTRHLIALKRWYDFSFLYGVALLAWWTGHLFAQLPGGFLHDLTMPAHFMSYLFLLMALQSFPLSPHLYYERWKTMLDMAILTLLFLAFAIALRFHPEHRELLAQVLEQTTALYILGPAYNVYKANQVSGQRKHNEWLLISSILFLLLGVSAHLLPAGLMTLTTLVVYGVTVCGLLHIRRGGDTLEVQEESRYFHEQLQFLIRDERVNLFLIFAMVVIITNSSLPLHYQGGMGLAIVMMVIRVAVTNRLNKQHMSQMFTLSSGLERQFEVNLREITKQNKHLSELLQVKQSYEKLLMESNSQSMREISYENLHDQIGEIVKIWFDTMVGLHYLRISLESQNGISYYELALGEREFADPEQSHHTLLRIVVDEQHDTMLLPRYVAIEAVASVTSLGGPDEDQSFFRLLGVHIRGLIQRCLQNQQSLDLRLLEQEMEMASKIQFSLIPRERFVLPDQLEAKALVIPVAYVGGDYIDYVAINDRYSCFLVADIAGHGMPASLLTTGLRHAFRAVIQTTVRPDEILQRLNRLLYNDLAGARSFVTMFVAVFDRHEQILLSSRAGHPQPFYLAAGRQMLLPCSGGVGLGMLPDAEFQQDAWPVEEDFTLLIYTDGLIDLGRKVESMTANDWLQHFSAVIDSVEPEGDTIAVLEREVWDWTRQRQQDDDVSVLFLQMKRQQRNEVNT